MPFAEPPETLDLFAQRVASPEVAPVATASFRGAGQSARADARAKARGTVEDAYRRIAQSLEGHGPQTRKELAASTGIPVNSVNARVSEMRQGETAPEFAVYTEGRRNGESVVHLSRLRHLLAVATPAPGVTP